MKLLIRFCLVLSLPLTAAESRYRITQFVDPNGASSTVIIGAGAEDGIVHGAQFNAVRRRAMVNAFSPQAEDMWIEMGTLKAFAVKPHYTLARVVESASPQAQAMFPKFPKIMAGDFVEEKVYRIDASKALTPTVSLAYADIFADPKYRPESFEFSAEGRQRIREAALRFADKKVSTLMIEGHTDVNGSAAENQVESQQRAVTVRQYLVDELGFDPKRVVAMGFGEKEPLVDGFVPQHTINNRRIVFKVIE